MNAGHGRHLRPSEIDDVFALAEILAAPVDLTGGEPFLSPHFNHVIDGAAKRNIPIGGLFTNGTCLTDSVALSKLASAFPSATLYVSLDGYGSAHDLFRGARSFELALSGAVRAKTLGLRVAINTMLHRAVDEENLKELYRVIVRSRFERWRIDTPFRAGRWRDAERSNAMPARVVFKRFQAVVQWFSLDRMPCDLELDHALKYIDGRFYYMDAFDLADPVCPCRILTVWSDGEITWCQDLHRRVDVIGRLGDDPALIYQRYLPYKTISIATLLRTTPEIFRRCSDCGLLRNCGLGCRANAILAGGGYNSWDPELCDLYTTGMYQRLADALRVNATCLNGEGQP